MDKHYNRFLITYQNKNTIFDPITRKTYIVAEERSRVDKKENLFQFDIEDDSSWAEITPGIIRVKTPDISEPNIAPQR